MVGTISLTSQCITDHGHDLLASASSGLRGKRTDSTFALVHRTRHSRAGNEIAAILRENHSVADRRQRDDWRGRCAACHLQRKVETRFGRRDRSRPCRSPIPERGRDNGSKLPISSRSSISLRCADGHAAVMRSNQGFSREFVHGAGNPFSEAAAVYENQRRPVARPIREA